MDTDQFHVHIHNGGFHELLTEVRELRAEMRNFMAAIDDKIAALQAEVTRETTIEKSAVALIQGISGQIAAAVQAALAAGATTAQLQSLTDLQTTLAANDDELSAAVTANTPATPPAA